MLRRRVRKVIVPREHPCARGRGFLDDWSSTNALDHLDNRRTMRAGENFLPANSAGRQVDRSCPVPDDRLRGDVPLVTGVQAKALCHRANADLKGAPSTRDHVHAHPSRARNCIDHGIGHRPVIAD
jgi:hypothetical protein